MSTKIIVLFCLLITVLLITGLAEAQQPKKIPRIGFLSTAAPPGIPTNHSDKDFVTLVMWRDKISPLNIDLEKAYPG